jgi:hypothetical protein
MSCRLRAPKLAFSGSRRTADDFGWRLYYRRMFFSLLGATWLNAGKNERQIIHESFRNVLQGYKKVEKEWGRSQKSCDKEGSDLLNLSTPVANRT